MLNSCRAFFTLKHRDEPLTVKHKVLLFILLMLGQQAILVIYGLFDTYHLPWLGGVISLLIAWTIVKVPLSYVHDDFKRGTTKELLKIVTLNFLLLFVTLAIWTQFTIRVLKKPALTTSVNQSNIDSFLHSMPAIIVIMLVAIVIGPIIEEFCFRYLMISSPNWSNTGIRVATSSILFGLFHVITQLIMTIQNGNNTMWINTISDFGEYMIIGFILGFIYARHHNFKYNLVMHSVWNALAMIAALLLIH